MSKRYMDCEQAQHLFDAYLDGELSPSLSTELGAHRLKCSECRRALALLEVSEHILSLDRDPVSLDENFSERLVACVERRATTFAQRAGRWLYVGGPIAAAAVIALAFLGVFDDRHETEVAGTRVVAESPLAVGEPDPQASSSPVDRAPSVDPLLAKMVDRAQSAIQTKRRSVESLQAAFDMTLQVPLDLLEKAQQSEKVPDATPKTAPRTVPAASNETTKPADDLEDL